MRELINQLYDGELKDVRKKVSRYEYEMREASNKIDMAELFMRMNTIQNHLESNGMVIPELDNISNDKELLSIIKEDTARLNDDIAESLFEKKLQKRQSIGRGDEGLFGQLRKWAIDKSVSTAPINEQIKNNLATEFVDVDFSEL